MLYTTSSKAFIILLLLAAIWPQSNEEIGKITYFEGRVEVTVNEVWTPANLNQVLRNNQSVRTGSSSRAEITWANGEVTLLGDNESHNAGELLVSFQQRRSAQAEGVFSRFREMFRSQSDDRRQQEGGIRRDAAEVEARPVPGELYWAVDEPVDLENAFEIYESGDFRAAIEKFTLYIDQQPNSPFMADALFFLGHSYLEMNNVSRAVSLFNRINLNFPGSEYARASREILETI